MIKGTTYIVSTADRRLQQKSDEYCGLEEVLLRVSRLVEDIHGISALDLNPIFTIPPGQGC
jgi:hypothetical protein